MALRKEVINGVEYNLLTDEELEELKFIIALEETRKSDKKSLLESYMSVEDFKRKGEKLYDV